MVPRACPVNATKQAGMKIVSPRKKIGDVGSTVKYAPAR